MNKQEPLECDAQRRSHGPLDAGASADGATAGLKALMLAVLEDGIGSYLGTAGVRRSEAEAWVASEGCGYPFAFRVVCETLGLTPEAVRDRLWGWRQEKRSRRAAIGRSRPNVRYAHWLVPPEVSRTGRHAARRRPTTLLLLPAPTRGGGLEASRAERLPFDRRR